MHAGHLGLPFTEALPRLGTFCLDGPRELRSIALGYRRQRRPQQRRAQLRRTLLVVGLIALSVAAGNRAHADTTGLDDSDLPRQIEIGVLSHRGDRVTQQQWGPTADYLTLALPRHCFRILPLAFSEVEGALASGRIQFLLVNPGMYVDLEVRYRISRIATLRNGTGNQARNRFGGVIFTRTERDDIAQLSDLRGKRLLAVDPNSFGGFLMQLDVLRQQGIAAPRALAALEFAGIHDAVVLGVRDGRADAGMVRTDILERMANQGSINLSDFRVLASPAAPDFALLLSTPLYPEWPFSTLQHTPNALAQQVAVALMQMPQDDPAALAGGYAGWTVPLDYQPVHQLLQALGRPPYDQPTAFTLSDALRRYWPAVVLGLLALGLLAALSGRLKTLNARLNRAKSRLEQRQELILNSVAEGIYGVDLCGRTTFVNKAVERLTGWDGHQLIGCNQHQVLHHAHRQAHRHEHRQAHQHAHHRTALATADEDCPVYATFRDQRPRFVEDDLFWRRDGSCFPVEFSTTPIRDERGNTVGSVVVFRDITERREAAERIRGLQREQARAARLSTLGEMASGIAHELNQPLTAISTNARACVRLVENGRGNLERCTEVMTKIADQAERAGEIIRHIRRFVRKEPLETASVAVADLFETVLVLLHQDAGQHAVEIHANIDTNVGAVRVQRIEIEQVILNLARNAVEAMAEIEGPHRLWLEASRADNPASIQIRVKDTGPGIPEQIHERLFEPFVTTKRKGLGLGLSISAGIVESHGSRLSLCQQPSGGACFAFNLPVAPEVPQPPHPGVQP
ncbi:PhnD/SsuA/transferrin family substrate-binding protein [Lamprobacter modestohalophilus]|uniref:PhnD/SsuA/transferrin family substrate-binding protein n=1 Tax=Lamprobacter modestohalophilus TaxID=1064514 RepID=UPI001904C77A|nr:PhnD/SsuA/transferrin family substrate-binding protein [Lamprobacter modestohalophilus]